MNQNRIVIGIGGASGSIYAQRLLQKLSMISDQWEDVGVVITANGIINWEIELEPFDSSIFPFTFYGSKDFNAPFASGSARYSTMIVCPCSMGLLGRIANGTSGDLITRAADVMLKERRKLILVPREAPYNLVHLRNMQSLTEAGAIICPASPSFYSKPSSLIELVDTIVDRLLDIAGFDIKGFRWGESD